MRFRVWALVWMALVAYPACAAAVMVSPKAGEVRVGSGQGFRLIVAPTEVAAGAQVMVSPAGAASIAYSDTCVVPAPAAALTVIESQPPCASLPEPSHFGFAQSNEEGVAIDNDQFGFTPKVDAPDPADPPAGASRQRRSTTAQDDGRPRDHDALLLVGGVVVGAGVIAAILASQGSDKPASP